VGFRYSAQREAESLGLTGWVRNLPSGEVEGVAQGDPQALEDFMSWLGQGPSHAVVREVERRPETCSPRTRFEIRR
jgi:acylphosphatase